MSTDQQSDWRPPREHEWRTDRVPLSFNFGVTAWLVFVALFAISGGLMIFNALTGSDRRDDWLAHHGRQVAAQVVRCDQVPESTSPRSCALRYAVDGHTYAVSYRNRHAQFHGKENRASTVEMLVDQRHPATRPATLFDVERRSDTWRLRIVLAAALLVFGGLMLVGPIVVDYLP